ncbi:MAG: hypothetical protein NVS1B4_03620 [Gemmatimonadaceae bacterium]
MLLALSAALLLSAVAPSDSVRPELDVRGIVLRHAMDVRRCYQSEGLRRNALLSGTIEVELVILPTGVVEEVRVGGTAIAGAGTKETLNCIATAARNWRFERGPYALEAVTFPFELRPEAPTRVAALQREL